MDTHDQYRLNRWQHLNDAKMKAIAAPIEIFVG